MQDESSNITLALLYFILKLPLIMGYVGSILINNLKWVLNMVHGVRAKKIYAQLSINEKLHV